MLKINKDQMRLPIGGHHFPSHGNTFKGDTLVELVEKITEFRINNGINIGNPEQEVLTFYYKNWPYMVKEVDNTKNPDEESLRYIYWRSWIQKTWKNPPNKFASLKEASDRWTICETCPFNVKKDWDKTDESEELTRRSFLLSRGYVSPKSIGFCSLHNADIAAFSFIDAAKEFSAKKDGGSHAACWVGQ